MDLPTKNKIRFLWNKIIESNNTNKTQDVQIEILKEELKNLRSQFDLYSPETETEESGKITKNDLKTSSLSYSVNSTLYLEDRYLIQERIMIINTDDLFFLPRIKTTPMTDYGIYEYGPYCLIRQYFLGCYAHLHSPSIIHTVEGMSGNPFTVYFYIDYITASGTDNWIFILLNKETSEISQICSTKDPYMLNYNPFNEYDKNKYEVILVDKKTTEQLSKQKGKESFVELINKHYIVDYKKEKNYIPLHSGKILEQGDKKVKHMIKNLPDYIKVRGLILK
jgi:hypothetical protein